MTTLRLRCALGLLATAALAGCTTGTPPDAAATAATRPSTATPASTATPTSIDAVVAQLLARPVAAPRLRPGSACPTSPVVEHSPVGQPADARGLGRAPIYPISFYAGDGALPLPTGTQAPEGLFVIKVVWASSDDYEGPAVVRVARLDGPGRGFVRLWYDPAATTADAAVFQVPRIPRDWPAGTFVSGPGCFAYQVDGVGFSELIYFSVR